jgi:hypothetical protein
MKEVMKLRHKLINIQIILFFLVGVPNNSWAQLQRLAAESGRYDFSHFSSEAVYQLGGNWTFFPNRIVEPREFLQSPLTTLQSAKEIAIGIGFTDGPDPVMKSAIGFGTYLVRLDHLPAAELALSGWTAFTSGRLYFFGEDGIGADKPLHDLGRFSPEPKDNLPQMVKSGVTPIKSNGQQSYYLLIQIGNFHHTWGGLWIAPNLGSYASVSADYTKNQEINFWLIGITTFVSIYSFALFLRRREDTASLWLSLYSLERTCRTFWYTNNGTDWLNNLKWSYELNYKLQWFFWLPSVVLIIGFLRASFPKQMKRWFLPFVAAFSGIPYVLVLFTPVLNHYDIIKPLYSLGNPLVGSIYIWIVHRALRDRVEGANWLLVGMLAMVLSGIVDILFSVGFVVFNFNNVSGIGMAAFLVCQTQIIAQRFSHAFRKAEYLSAELRKEVDRQTRDIKSILDTIKQGIFSVHAVEDRIDPQYSLHLTEIVGSEDVGTRNLKSLILEKSSLDSDQRAQILSCLDASFGENVINFELNQANLVREFTYQPVKGTEKILEVDWTPMLDSQSQVEKVLVNLRDVTEVRQLQLRAAQHEEDLKILIELIQIPEDRFHRFLHKTKEYLKQNRELVLQFEESRPDVIKQLFVNIHTIKGTARTYLLRSISSATHEVEEYYHLLAQGQNVWNKTVLLADISRIEELIERYRSVGEEKLGWQLTERLIKMSSSTLESVLASLNEIASEHLNPHQTSLVKSVRSLLFSVGFVSIQDVIDEACRGLDSVARDLEKLKPRFDVELPLVVMRDQGVNLMHGILVHLLRNSMDHGIERPAQRLLVGKQEAGIIYVHAVIRDKRLHIEYGDDGGGLNIEAIKQKAISRNLIKSDAPMTPQSIANLIFEAGLSTKSTVSDISGRGVGLDAVKRYLEEAGGSISIVLAKVEDVQQVPFRFVLEIPDAYFIPVEPNEKSKAS